MSIRQVEKTAWRTLRDLVTDLNPEMSQEEAESELKKLRRFVRDEGPIELVQKQAEWLNPSDEILWHVIFWACLFDAYMNTEGKQSGKTRMDIVRESNQLEIPTVRPHLEKRVGQNDHLEEMGIIPQFAIYLTHQTGAPIEFWKEQMSLEDVLNNNEALCILTIRAVEDGDVEQANKFLPQLRERLGDKVVDGLVRFAKIIRRRRIKSENK